MEYLLIGIRWLFGVVFLMSFLSKVAGREAFRAFRAFAASVADLAVARWAAPVVIVAEAAVAVLLALPFRSAHLVGLGAAAALLTAFSAGILRSLARGVRAPCRCFGRSRTPLGAWHVVRNCVLTAVAATGAVVALGSASAVDLGGMAVAAVAGLVLGGLVSRLEAIADLFRSTDVGIEARRAHVRSIGGSGTRGGVGTAQSDLHSRGDQAVA
ncbi:MauE/DoxX family redox-associated membrane protein [Nonomuraea typhae]|uniref:MauE/DoxX family redox-associated membrane protein n=1 Tax=Nonomuraea typhae TaxID=2603600 RepID=UPI0012F9051C|nr:MauE/DoxX family redox-associated membrane protein [Nonomuraea typhae]